MNNSLLDETNENQRLAADPNISAWASANAGAGKTKVLIDRIARLLLTGVAPDKILAVTYTKAAAAEMTSRLFQTLGEWTIADDVELEKKLKKLEPKIEIDSARLSNARTLFARALETPGGLKIQTIHAFCGTILKRFPIEAGVAPGFEVLDDIGAQKLKNETYEIAATKAPEDFILISSLTSSDKNKEVIANAGQKLGKFKLERTEIETRLKEYFNWQPEKDPDELLQNATLCLTDSLALDCSNRLNEITGATNEKTAKKLEKFAQVDEDQKLEILKGLIFTSGKLRASPPIAGAATKDAMLINLFGQKSKEDGWQLSQILSEFLENLTAFETDKICRSTLALNNAASIWQSEYERQKNQKGRLDFGDLLAATARLFNQGEAASLWVLYKLDQGISHILIDESQDTSAEQWDLLKPIFTAMEQAAMDDSQDKRRSQFIVGDEKQSIYSFQGASPERFLDERKSFTDIKYPDGRENRKINFTMSFRTGSEILQAVDYVWELANDSEFKSEFEANEASSKKDKPVLEYKATGTKSHFSAREGQCSSFELWPVEMGIEQEEEERDYWDHPVDLILESSPINQLAEQIAKEIKHRIHNKAQIWNKDGSTRAVEAKDFMILVKQRKSLFHQIIRRLKASDVAVAGSDVIILNQEIGVIDLLCLGQFLLRPEDDFNLACVLKGAFCNLYDDDKHLFPLAYNRGDETLWSKLKASQDEIYKIPKQFLQSILENCQGLSPFDFLSFVLEREHIFGKTGWDCLHTRFGFEVREPIEVLLDLALNAQRSGVSNLHAFIDYIENNASEAKRDFDGSEDGVKVMTVHGSKGREAPIVILPDTTRALPRGDGNLLFEPKLGFAIWVAESGFKLEKIENLKEASKARAAQEDNRLLYVAMTRARDKLIMCGHKFGKKPYSKMSWYNKFELAFANLPEFKTRELTANYTGKEAAIAKIWGDEPNQQLTANKIIASKEIALPKWVKTKPPQFDPPPKRIAPSILIDESEPAVISPTASNMKNRYRRGRLIHELLQNLPNVAQNMRTAWAKRKLNREADLNEETREEIIFQAMKIVEDEQFAEIFGENSRAEVAIVGKGKNLPQDIIINGTIDRLLIKPDEILVLDFKTNRPPPQKIEEAPQTYINQMAAYRDVLNSAYPNKPIRCALLWTDTPILMEIPHSMLDDALLHISQTSHA